MLYLVKLKFWPSINIIIFNYLGSASQLLSFLALVVQSVEGHFVQA